MIDELWELEDFIKSNKDTDITITQRLSRLINPNLEELAESRGIEIFFKLDQPN